MSSNRKIHIKALSTSLGVALVVNLLALPTVDGQESIQPDKVKLTEWSTEEVKEYFDAAADWNIPNPEEIKKEKVNVNKASNTLIASPQTEISHGGFGWDDLLLYHLIFNRGGAYNSSSWSSSNRIYHSGTSTPYKTKTFNSDSFQNRSVTNSSVRPHTSTGAGSITRRSSVSKSTSSNRGGIGGRSSGFSSSGGKSGGFGG